MDGDIMNILKLFALVLAISLPCAMPANAQEVQNPAQSQSLQNAKEAQLAVYALPSVRAYAEKIFAGDPAAASAFLKDAPLVSAASAADGSALKAQAMAIQDLHALMNKEWKIEQHRDLSKALMIRIAKDKPLTRSGIGPQPETLIPWLKKYIKRYNDAEQGEQRIYVVNQAILNWETVFGNVPSKGFEWDNVPLTITKNQWAVMSIQERKATVKKIGTYMARNFNDYSLLAYDDSVVQSITVQQQQAIAINKAIESGVLNKKQKKELAEARSLSDKAYLLNKFFDGSNVKHSDDMRLSINANRQSTPEETFSASNRQVFASMLGNSIRNELSGTEAGRHALDGGLKIEIAYCDSGYSSLKQNGTIVLDEETIQQYMRLKGYTASSVMSDASQLADIARYMSPAVVYEAAHRDQAKWAKKKGAYKPHTQEDEIDAMSAEALYTAEKMQKDSSFAKTFTEIESYSNYAAKRMENASSYTQGKKMFADNVRLGCSELPTISSAASSLIAGINDELARRSKLTAEERDMEYSFISYNEAINMSPDQILSSLRDIQEGALTRLRSSIASNDYSAYNSAAIAKTRSSYNDMLSAAGKKSERNARREFVPVP